MKLWHATDARSFRPLWMLEEMGLAYELELVPFPPRYRKPGWLDVNPLGTIPYFTDGAVAMTESTGICHYLGVRYGPTPLMVEPHEPDYGAFLNFLYQSDATLTFPQTLVLRYRLFEPEERRQPQVASDYAKWFVARTVWVDRWLGDGRDVLVGGRFTAADIAVGYAFLLAEFLGLLGEVSPTIRAWWDRLKAREGFRRAKARQAEPAGAEAGRATAQGG
ncbi:glutathione S-transferase family protein [Thermaurantiacus sp.]